MGMNFLFLESCSTEKNAPINRFYHDLNAKYNGYFNAKVILDDNISRFREGYKDEYYKVLPIELYPTTEEQVQSFEPEMEVAIEKCEKVIQKHSMPNPSKKRGKKEEEWCKWIDDNYLVIGQASYLMGDYSNAVQKLEYVRKFYKNQSSQYEAELWLARTHLALNNVPEAVKYLEKVESHLEEQERREEEKKEMSFSQKRTEKRRNKRKDIEEPAEVPDYIEGDYHLLKAEVALLQDDLGEAIVKLEEAVKFYKGLSKRKERARINYILAQLYQNTGNQQNSMMKYKKVIKSPVKYAMRFNAKINRAMQGSGASLKKDLRKMLRDSKNNEYRDQIYYALAEIYWNEQEKESAVENYKKSTFYSVSNDRQKGLSYLKLADIHFDDKIFEKAKVYYDSAAAFLPEEYPNYLAIKNKGESLTELVNNLNVVSKQDSLQKIAEMPEKERETYLEELVEEIEKQREEERRDQEERMLAMQEMRESVEQDQGSGANWYFYNEELMGKGENEFRRNFGERPLEDNWRRKNKASTASEFEEEGDESVDSTAVPEDSLSVEILAKGLPLTDSAMNASNLMIYEALYRLGVIYKEELKDYSAAIEKFEDIISRTDEKEHVLPALYQLYLTYRANGQQSESDARKADILNNYPNSDFANVIRDPDYMRNKNKEKFKDLNDYIAVVESYEKKRYGLVIAKCTKVTQNDTANQFMPKYMLLKVFAIGQTRGNTKRSLMGPITSLVDKFPETEEGKFAKKLLYKLEHPEELKEGIEDKVFEAPSPYTYREEKHLFVLIVDQKRFQGNKIKSDFSDYNEHEFSDLSLNTNAALFGDDKNLIMIQYFEDKNRAMQYYTDFSKTRKKVAGYRAGNKYFVVGSSNFSTFFNQKDLEGYEKFFKKNYLKQD